MAEQLQSFMTWNEIMKDTFKWQALKEPKRVQLDKKLHMSGLQQCIPKEKPVTGFW
jgi:hypothetical protein